MRPREILAFYILYTNLARGRVLLKTTNLLLPRLLSEMYDLTICYTDFVYTNGQRLLTAKVKWWHAFFAFTAAVLAYQPSLAPSLCFTAFLVFIVGNKSRA